MAKKKNEMSGFVDPEPIMTPKVDALFDLESVASSIQISDSKFSNGETIESGDVVVPRVVGAIVELLVAGPVAPHRVAVHRYLSDRALSLAIAKIQSLRRKT